LKVKARVEGGVLRLLERLELKEGKEFEIELLKEKAEFRGKRAILRYAGLLKDLNEEEERLFHEAVGEKENSFW
jgi:predicted DNA-binding antitoxin AbrB/MazE fold protein